MHLVANKKTWNSNLLQQCREEFHKLVSEHAAVLLPGILLEMQTLGVYPRLPESVSQKVGPRCLCFNKPSRWFLFMMKFKKHEGRRFVDLTNWKFRVGFSGSMYLFVCLFCLPFGSLVFILLPLGISMHYQ